MWLDWICPDSFRIFIARTTKSLIKVQTYFELANGILRGAKEVCLRPLHDSLTANYKCRRNVDYSLNWVIPWLSSNVGYECNCLRNVGDILWKRVITKQKASYFCHLTFAPLGIIQGIQPCAVRRHPICFSKKCMKKEKQLQNDWKWACNEENSFG